ncbi:helix-turn-helix domain-containing protein [Paenibacillus sp. LMG 31456]|uniref:Helix-turn-helix domain-containing protein n=1 Tax=Paenibacillus foliorum TaxID=2654974 RepID=A0A972K3S1_9BACL|nr:helix-turn-helix domain-containing protein [Paenibacillus foliorum]NOU97270.1 helix-turn-helix domain-containing protein [Paenibacillus foliorum]
MNSNALKPSMGILNLVEGEKKFTLSRYAPSEDIGFFVKHFWVVSWDLTGHAPYNQELVPNPCVNLIIEPNKTAIYGIPKNKSSYLIREKGHVLGVKFKPGGFYPFIRQSVSVLNGNPMGVENVFDVDARAIEDTILNQQEDSKMVELAEHMIRQKLPARDENITLINRVIDQIIEDREITKVDHISQQLNINIRKLQRLFEQYVGVSPKWVIKLYRLQNAAESMDLNQNHNLLKLSMDLGYYDQSHFIKDFKSIIGITPDEYIRKFL